MDAGRQHKLRPGDLLGALTGDAGIDKDAVGKIVTGAAFDNGRWIIDFQQGVGSLFELSLQAFVEQSSLLIQATSYTYWLSQFAVKVPKGIPEDFAQVYGLQVVSE